MYLVLAFIGLEEKPFFDFFHSDICFFPSIYAFRWLDIFQVLLSCLNFHSPLTFSLYNCMACFWKSGSRCLSIYGVVDAILWLARVWGSMQRKSKWEIIILRRYDDGDFTFSLLTMSCSLEIYCLLGWMDITTYLFSWIWKL